MEHWNYLIHLLKTTLILQDYYIKGHTDGIWNGVKLFDSQPGKGIFVPLSSLRPDTRFGSGSNNTVMASNRMFTYQCFCYTI